MATRIYKKYITKDHAKCIRTFIPNYAITLNRGKFLLIVSPYPQHGRYTIKIFKCNGPAYGTIISKLISQEVSQLALYFSPMGCICHIRL